MTDAHLATSDPSCARRAIAWNVRCTGRGGLGQYGLELLRLLTGCAVIAVDTSETKRRVAKELGAAHALDGNDPQLASKILDLTGGSRSVSQAAPLREVISLAERRRDRSVTGTKHDGRSAMLDGFEPHDADALVGFRPDACERFARRIERLGRLLHVEVDGLHRLPAGRALLVANHAFGWDVAFAMAAIRTRIGRPIFALGEHLWWKVPYLRRLAASVGTVDGTPDNVDRLLDAEQLVLVLPGGLREAVKPSTLRYRLLWGERYGFVRAAIKNRAPMVPLASIGADEVFELTGDAYARGRKIGLSLPLPRFSSLPHRVHLRYVIGEPVAPIDPPSSCDDPSVLKRARWTIEGALQELIDRELGSRSH